MESKSCFICCVLMLLVLSSTNVFAQEGRQGIAQPAMSEGSPKLIRAQRGVIKSALKGAAVGAAGGAVAHAVSKGK
uniref:Uncharacterized protein n=1 Tax=Panagrolaimus sp. ES5 TaxID=591445 RepID=A0AC34FD67_9BILA